MKRVAWMLLLGALVAAAPARADPPEKLDTVELVPTERAGWSLNNLFAPLTGLVLGGPGYWYSRRRIEIRTTPPNAALELFYVRQNFQKGYEQADSPVVVLLPSRVEAGPRDSLTIRALLDGYRQTEVSVRVRSRQEKVMIDLEPLANTLVATTHLYFADRATLTFLTKESLTFRVQKLADGYSLVLLQTAGSAEADAMLAGVSDALISSLGSQQLGEDLVVRIALSERARAGDVDVRSRQSFDPIRRLHAFSLDIAPQGSGALAVTRAREALARIGAQHVTGCAARFDAALHEQLDPAALSRALTPEGSFTDPYLRAALKRLGEIQPGGAVVMGDGTRYRTSIPLELAAASSQAGEVQGYLALLRQFVAELEPAPYRRETLRGLIAPEVNSQRFDAMMGQAEGAERACLARGD
jgi:hypothetical protein